MSTLDPILASLALNPVLEVSRACINLYWLLHYAFIHTEEDKKFSVLHLSLLDPDRPVVKVPPAWEAGYLQDLESNPSGVILRTGNVVSIASFANDWYDGKPFRSSAILHRAYGLEAGYYHWLVRPEAEGCLNEYQRQIMRDYPNGWDSVPPEHVYEYRPVHLDGWAIPPNPAGPEVRPLEGQGRPLQRAEGEEQGEALEVPVCVREGQEGGPVAPAGQPE